MTYIIPVNPEAKAHKLNNIGKPMCGAKLAPGSTKSNDLGKYKLCGRPLFGRSERSDNSGLLAN